MCCKYCQSCLETIYWHCFEKHFCYDESIALYEDETTIQNKSEEKFEKVNHTHSNNNNIYDNLAFYDNVAMIANRAIFCIEPSKTTKYEEEIITKQPRKKAKIWYDDESISASSSTEFDFGSTKSISIPIIKEDLIASENGSSISLPTITEETSLTNANKLKVETPVKFRKMSLHERRVSKSLTLKIEKAELPIIRQSSFPKFYLDTPEGNQTDSSIKPSAIQALETPILPQSQFKFDLRSVVQIENEKTNSVGRSIQHKDNKISQIRDKLKPLKSLNLRSSSSNSVNSSS